MTNHVSAVIASPISNMPLFNTSSFATVNGSNLDASVAAHQHWCVPQVASPFGLMHPAVGAPPPLPFNGMTNGGFGSNHGMIMPNHSTPTLQGPLDDGMNGMNIGLPHDMQMKHFGSIGHPFAWSPSLSVSFVEGLDFAAKETGQNRQLP